MNILTTSLVLLLSFTISISEQQTKTILQETVKIESLESFKEFTVNDKDYTLHFKIENADNQNPTLVIAIELYNESYYISPNAKRDFSGKFNMDLGSYNNLNFKGDVIETPRSIEEYDSHPFTNGLVNWVHVNTTYKQSLQLKTKEKFVVFGRVQFTIEPRCTFEEIPFAISYKDGEMKFIDPKC
ncbi:MAG: hypothetical protein KAH67_07435 [Flavobacteriaceae bacterium]|nr:hypothetical protein [Flavobacteriaceae bacterium]